MKLGLGINLGLSQRQASSVAAFDPATLALSGWWRASYSGSPWTAVASAGDSGSNGDLSEATNPPSVGTAVNGRTPAVFNGTNSELSNANAVSTFVTASAYTIVALFWASAADLADPSGNSEPPLWNPSNGSGAPCLSYSTSGIRAEHHDGAWKSTTVAASTGAWHMAFMRYGGTNIEVGVDSGALSTVPAGNVSSVTGSVVVGKIGWTGGSFFNGMLLELMTAKIALTDDDRTNLRSYFNSRHGLVL